MQEQELNAVTNAPGGALACLSDTLKELQKPATGPKNGRPIFESSSQLGLYESPAFQKFFISLSEESQNIKFARLSRQAFKEFLQKRYTGPVGERIMLYLENQFQSLYRIDIHGFCNVIREFLNAGAESYKKLLFSCLSLQNQGRICEHDLFQLIENFRQRESFYFYKEVISMPNQPRDFNRLVDFSDRIFFDAYAEDVKRISSSLSFKQSLQGTSDPASWALRDKDLDPDNFPSHQEYLQAICSQIAYLFSFIQRKVGSQHMGGVMDTLLKIGTLPELRRKLIDYVKSGRLAAKRDRKQTGE